jgi:hypothetical protein
MHGSNHVRTRYTFALSGKLTVAPGVVGARAIELRNGASRLV